MEDSLPTPTTTPEPPRRRCLTPLSLSTGLVILALLAATGEYVLFGVAFTVNLPISVVILAATCTALAITAVALHLTRHWRNPVRRLQSALEEIRDGTLPIDHLPTDVRGLAPLAPVLADILRTLRTQKAEVAKLNLEMSQRVAQRTDALERLCATLRAQSTRDGLTGLYNRRMLDLSLEKLIQTCRADMTPLCLLMVDVDHFKLLNDTLGHAAGDALLRAIGQLVRSSVREQDLPFRCGGDEFIIVVPGATYTHGESLAQRLSDLVDALVKPLNVPRKPRLSIGMATLAELAPEDGVKELLEVADQHLYAIKSERKTHRAA